MDFRRSQPPLLPVSIEGVSVEVVNTYKYLGVHMDNKLDWSANVDAIYKKGQSRLYFLRRLRSFNFCNKLLRMFYQSVVASVLFYAVVCWGGSIKKRDAGRLDRMVRKAGAVVATELDCLTTMTERRTLSRLLTILDNDHHPPHSTLNRQRSTFSGRLLSLSCSSDRLRKSPGPYSFTTPCRKGGGGRWTSLHGSTSVSPSLLISLYSIPLSIFLLAILAPCTDFTIYITLHYPHTHTSTSTLSLHYPHKHMNTISLHSLHYFPRGHQHCQCTL